MGERRPIKARESGWARATALWLARRGVTPNMVSVASIACAIVAAAGFAGVRYCPSMIGQYASLGVIVLGVQARLICNLLDGMIAVEAGVGGGRLGEIYNDLPDRIADPIILLSAMLAADVRYGPALAVAATTGALLTAYVRVLGRSIGARAHFAGPMAKQHRMAVLTVACIGAAVALPFGKSPIVFSVALGVIAIGCLITVVRRLRLISSDLPEKA